MAAGEQRHRRWMRPAGLVAAFPPALGERCSASRSAEESSRWRASAAQTVAARKRQALAQRAGERRICGEEFGRAERARRRRGTPPRRPRRRRRPARFGGRAQDGTACSNSGLVGAKLGFGAPARPPSRQGDGRRAARFGGGSFVIEEVGRSESDHGFSITQGGALSPCSAPNPPRLSSRN